MKKLKIYGSVLILCVSGSVFAQGAVCTDPQQPINIINNVPNTTPNSINPLATPSQDIKPPSSIPYGPIPQPGCISIGLTGAATFEVEFPNETCVVALSILKDKDYKIKTVVCNSIKPTYSGQTITFNPPDKK